MISSTTSLTDQRRSAVVYCVLTFAGSWLIWIWAKWTDNSDINLHLFYLSFTLSSRMILVILGNIVPGLVALVMAYVDDPAELGALIRQFRFPKSSWRMYAFAMFLPIALYLVMMVALNTSMTIFRGLGLHDFLRLFLVNIWLAPLWEEIGWRGYLLPMLLKRMGLGQASLLLGVIWGSWHFMLYYAAFGQTFSSFALSFPSLMAMSLILAILYSASANSLVLPILLHTSWNAATNCLVIAGFHFTLYSQLFQALALSIVAAWLWRRLRASAAIKPTAIS